MDRTKALIVYMKLRARRDRLSQNPPDTKDTVYERFTSEMEAELRDAERVLNRLSGIAAIELLIAQRASVLGFINGR